MLITLTSAQSWQVAKYVIDHPGKADPVSSRLFFESYEHHCHHVR